MCIDIKWYSNSDYQLSGQFTVCVTICVATTDQIHYLMPRHKIHYDMMNFTFPKSNPMCYTLVSETMKRADISRVSGLFPVKETILTSNRPPAYKAKTMVIIFIWYSATITYELTATPTWKCSTNNIKYSSCIKSVTDNEAVTCIFTCISFHEKNYPTLLGHEGGTLQAPRLLGKLLPTMHDVGQYTNNAPRNCYNDLISIR